MATLNISCDRVCISPIPIDGGFLPFAKSNTTLIAACSSLELSRLLMTGIFPLRIVAGIIWGQGKSAAEADCQRRLKEAGRWPAK